MKIKYAELVEPKPVFGQFGLLVDLLTAAIVVTGVGGALWISDDLDVIRFPVLTYVGMPIAILYLATRWLYPRTLVKRPRLQVAAVAAIFLCFSVGGVSLVNALSASPEIVKRTVTLGTAVTNLDTHRGAFGLLFKKRF